MSKKPAYDYLIYLLARQDYTYKKLDEKLKDKDYSPEEREEALTLAQDQGYIREDLFAQARTRGLLRKGYSIYYIQQKLEADGVNWSTDEINSVFTELGITELDNLRELAERKSPLPLSELNDNFKAKAKLMRFLQTKGYSHHLISQALGS